MLYEFDDKKQFELQIVQWMHKIWLLLKPNHLSNRPTFFYRIIFEYVQRNLDKWKVESDEI